MKDWDALLYNRFIKERIQPSMDLAARIGGEPQRIMDLGCGSGFSTLVLQQYFPKAELVGLDSSVTMLEQAREKVPEAYFYKKDCNESLIEYGEFDCIFSNAVFQWLRDQKKVMKHCFDILHQGGCLAVQIPLFEEMPASACIKKVANSQVDSGKVKEECRNETIDYYYNALIDFTDNVTLWETDYYHIMKDCNQIVDFLKSTALRPHLDPLDDAGQKQFQDRLRMELEQVYPRMADGNVLFPFKRFFLLARKK